MPTSTPIAWRYSGPIPVISNARKDILDTIADWLNNATSYPNLYNGSSVRAPGTFSAWEAIEEVDTGDTVALRLVPPDSGARPHQRVLIAAHASTTPATFTAIPSDIYTNNHFYAGIVRDMSGIDEGDYTQWDSATPYTGADFSGWGRFAATQVITHVEIVESMRAISIWLRVDALNTPMSAMMGGAMRVGGLVETDGMIYGLWTGGGANVTTNFLISIAASQFGYNATNNNPKMMTFAPAGGIELLSGNVLVPGSSGITNLSGRIGNNFMRYPLGHCVTMNSTPLRGVIDGVQGLMVNMQSGTVLTADGTPTGDVVGILMGATVGTVNNVMVFIP